MSDPSSYLSPALLAKTMRRPGGSLAWRRSDAMRAIEELARAGFANLGGEAWLVLSNGHLYGQIPPADGGRPIIYAWTVSIVWTPEAESWEHFCGLSADESREKMAALRPEDDVSVEHRDDIWFNIEFVDRDEYAHLMGQNAADIG